MGIPETMLVFMWPFRPISMQSKDLNQAEPSILDVLAPSKATTLV